jgi:Ser/Thr protein kinase RdoA (MazF antagonist)
MAAPSRTFDTRAVAAAFALQGDYVAADPYGSGHINDTFCLRMSQGGTPVRYILQRINHAIFKDPDGLMTNVARVCEHAQAKLRQAGAPDATRRALTLVPARSGKAWHTDAEGNRWRCYLFVEGATGHDIIRNAAQAREAARAFGAFQALMADLPGGRLTETIPNFHHTPSRFARFQQVLKADAHGRAKGVAREVDFVLARAADMALVTDGIAKGEIPERVTHNDTKLNNVLLDNATQEGVCVIDLDTVMPGSALYDFGDLVRTSTSPAAEDETDLSKVALQTPMYEALVSGYLSTAGAFLNPRERELLPFGGKLMTLEVGMRFLTDWLEGDVYFKVKRPGHNLDRCRTQLRLVELIEAQLPALQALAAKS